MNKLLLLVLIDENWIEQLDLNFAVHGLSTNRSFTSQQSFIFYIYVFFAKLIFSAAILLLCNSLYINCFGQSPCVV